MANLTHTNPPHSSSGGLDAFVRHYRLERSDVDPEVLSESLFADEIPLALHRALDLTSAIERKPWDQSEIAVLVRLVDQYPPTDMPKGSGPGPARIRPDAVTSTIQAGYFWRCYTAFAQRLSDDELVTFLESVVRPNISHARLIIEDEAIALQVTDIDRLRVLLATSYPRKATASAVIDLVRSVIPTLNDLNDLAPILSTEQSTDLIASLITESPVLPSRRLLEALSAAHPDLGLHLLRRDSQDPQLPYEWRRLLLYVAGFAPAVLTSRTTSPPSFVSHVAYPTLIALLERCDPAVRPLLDNPAASLAQALGAARALVVV